MKKAAKIKTTTPTVPHERAHGCVSQTISSCKSDLIQSYILSLAVNFRPQDVGLVFCDRLN